MGRGGSDIWNTSILWDLGSCWWDSFADYFQTETHNRESLSQETENGNENFPASVEFNHL